MRKNEKKAKVTNENLISKSNELSLSKLNRGLTLQQVQLLSYAIYYTQHKGVPSFRKSEFERYFGTKKYETKSAKEDVGKLMDLKISTEDLNQDSFAYWNVFGKIAYNKGVFEFQWTPDMIPHIMELKEKFVLLDLMTTSKFTSSFSWKLYEFLKAKHGYWNIRISRREMLNLFSVEKSKSYQQNSSIFKKRVLDPAISEINRLTELDIYYNEIKENRKIVAFELVWSKGATVKLASKKQVDELQLYIDTLMQDMLNVFNLSLENQQEALKILNEVRSYQDQINMDLVEQNYVRIREALKKKMSEYQALYIQKV